MANFPVTAVTGIIIGSSSDVARSPINVTALSGFSVGSKATHAAARVFSVTASSGFVVGSISGFASIRSLAVTASSGLAIGSSASASSLRSFVVTASSGFGLGSTASDSPQVARIRSSTAGFGVGSSASSSITRTLSVTASTGISVGSRSDTARSFSVTASSGFVVGSTIAKSCQFSVTALSSFSISSKSGRFRQVAVTASTGISVGSLSHRIGPASPTASSAFGIGSIAHVVIGGLLAQCGFAVGSTANVSISSPGGSPAPGLQELLLSGVSGDFPFSYTETPRGEVVLANGVGPMLIWNPLSASVRPAGVTAPSPCLLGATGAGTITGDRVAYVRFIDLDGNPSDLSPASNLVGMGHEGFIDDIVTDPVAGYITIRSVDHGITNQTQVVIRGVQGMEILNGKQTAYPSDLDHFTVGLRSTANTWTQGGTWTWGMQSIVYSAVPIPTSTRVARRQILRNLEGSLDVLYVDVDTPDLAASSFTSTLDDESLAAREPVSLVDSENGLPVANRYAPPPNWKSVVVSHSGRIFAAVDAAYSTGSVLPVPGSQQMAGVGTQWNQSMVGRSLFVSGCPAELTITQVDSGNQLLAFTGTMSKADTPYALYSIRPPDSERKLIYYSDPGSPDAWPAWNAVQVPEDGDAPVGLYGSGSYLYAVEARHLYRLVFEGNPAENGAIYLMARRGSVNHRCVVLVEGMAYMLDDAGIHSFDDQDDHHLSDPIQNLWHADGGPGPRIDQAADKTLWHASHDPARETIRWFVSFVGRPPLTDAVCYHVRRQSWWLERYSWPITSSATASVPYRRAVVGTDSRRVFALWEGTLDGFDGSGTTRGSVTTADALTINDSGANFASGLAGVPVAIRGGTGRGQVGVITSNTSTALSVKDAWPITPDATSTYQVGAVPWTWRSGWFVYSEDQTGNPREIEASYKPTVSPASFDFAVYYDNLAVPNSFVFDNSDDGIVTTAGSPYVTVDMARGGARTGYAMKRLEGHADALAYTPYYVSLELSGSQGSDPVVVYHCILSGVRTGIGGEQ